MIIQICNIPNKQQLSSQAVIIFAWALKKPKI